MGSIFLKLANMSITASYLILAVLILRIILKKSPKWVPCLLWGTVAVRLICPYSYKSTFSLIPSSEPVHTFAIQFTHNIAGNNEPVTTNTTSTVSRVWVFILIVSIIWFIGFIVLLCYSFIRYQYIKFMTREAALLWENIWLCDNVSSAFILGIINPRIYLSSSIEEKQIPYVVAHEQAHLKRKDHLWKLIGFLLLSIYWFHPLIWIAYIFFCRDMELACDEKAIQEFNLSERKQYSEALLFCSIHRKTILAYPLAFGEVHVKERIKRVLNYKKPTFLTVISAIFTCVLLVMCLLTDPVDHALADFKPIHGKSTDNPSIVPTQIQKPMQIKNPVKAQQEPTQTERTNTQKEKLTLSADGQEVQKIAEKFAAAYFSRDLNAMKQYLTVPYGWDIDAYPGTGTVDKITLKGLADIGEEETGSNKVVSLEYRDSNFEEMFLYLTMEFMKQENGWKIQFYGIEA